MTNEQKKDKLAISQLSALGAQIHKYFIFAIISAVIAVLLAGYFFLLNPKISQIKLEIANKEEVQSRQYDDLDSYLKRITKYKQSFDQINEDQMRKINIMLPENSEYEDLIVEVEKIVLGMREGLVLKSLTINPIEQKSTGNIKEIISGEKEEKKGEANWMESIGLIEIKAEIEGIDYGNLKKLLSAFENNLRLIDIKEIDSALDGQNLTLTMQTYYMTK